MSATAQARLTADGRIMLWCPACDEAHWIQTDVWAFDGNLERPTISPSILVRSKQWEPQYDFHNPRHQVEPGQLKICHSFVKDGRWQYLADCTHVMAGQTVEGVPFATAMRGI